MLRRVYASVVKNLGQYPVCELVSHVCIFDLMRYSVFREIHFWPSEHYRYNWLIPYFSPYRISQFPRFGNWGDPLIMDVRNERNGNWKLGNSPLRPLRKLKIMSVLSLTSILIKYKALYIHCTQFVVILKQSQNPHHPSRHPQWNF